MCPVRSDLPSESAASPSRSWLAGSSVVEDRKAQLVEVRGVGDRVDSDDLAVPDRETEYEEQPSTPGHDDSHGSVHESRSCSLGTPRELPGREPRTTDLPGRACRYGCAVAFRHNVPV